MEIVAVELPAVLGRGAGNHLAQELANLERRGLLRKDGELRAQSKHLR